MVFPHYSFHWCCCSEARWWWPISTLLWGKLSTWMCTGVGPNPPKELCGQEPHGLEKIAASESFQAKWRIRIVPCCPTRVPCFFVHRPISRYNLDPAIPHHEIAPFLLGTGADPSLTGAKNAQLHTARKVSGWSDNNVYVYIFPTFDSTSTHISGLHRICRRLINSSPGGPRGKANSWVEH